MGSRTPGSSPLARGLRRWRRRSAWASRIIPARAGFTDRRGPARVGSEDHPRSRGVYLPSSAASRATKGSSPLARGLPLDATDPAPAPMDHPRSRGVYPSPSPSPRSPAGSSPLARGLPPTDRPTYVIRRIIPARAGFTHAALRGRAGPRDHPRSRGVYLTLPGWKQLALGSSPLARGLPTL